MADIDNNLTPDNEQPTDQPVASPFTQALPKDYWISPTAVSMTFNAMSDFNKIQASVQSGAVIMCYMRGIEGLGYDNGHNYQRWRLTAAPTVFHDNDMRYIYVAIPKNSNVDNGIAQIVFPSREIDLYGVDREGEQYGNTDYFYIFLQGIISASVDESGISVKRDWYKDYARTWRIDFGSLATDQAIAEQQGEWFIYDSITETVEFIKEISNAIFQQLTVKTKMLLNGILDFGGHVLRGVAEVEYRDADGHFFPGTPEDSTEHIVTPAYGKEKYVSRQHDDTKRGSLTLMGNLLTSIANGSEAFVGSEDFMPNILGWGWRAYYNGHIEADSLRLRKFMEVPELRYNRTTITSGLTWHTIGAGIIEEVTQGAYNYLDSATLQTRTAQGMIKLKLEDGEAGSMAYNDLAMGVWHNLGTSTTTMNETEDYDGHDGNFTFAGFQTIYFRVVALCHKDGYPVEYGSDGLIKSHFDAAGNDITCRNAQYFLYELRPVTEGEHGWHSDFHPVSGMHFACYANPTDKDRQSCWYLSNTYILMLAGMTDWTYDSDNIQVILGQRDQFSIRIRDRVTHELKLHQLHGMGAAFGNITLWGSIDEVDRDPVMISQELLWCLSDKSPEFVNAMPFADILEQMEWHPMTVVAPNPTSTQPYIYQRWLITYDTGVTSDKYFAINPDFASSHPHLLPFLFEQWYDGFFTLQSQYAAVKRMDQCVFALTDPDTGEAVDLYGKGDIAYEMLFELVFQCLRYRNDAVTNGGYLTYHTDLDSTEYDYDETGVYGIDSDGNPYDYRGVSVKDAKDSVTFKWYKDDTKSELLRSIVVPVVYDGYSMSVEPDRQMTDLPRNQQLTLSAVVMMGELDITKCYGTECFKWRRVSGQSAEEQESDLLWAEQNAERLYGYTLTISDEDMYRRAKFDCEFYDGMSLTLVAGIQLTQIEDGYSCYLDNQGDMMGVGNNKIYDNESGDVEPMEFTSRFHLLSGNDEQELTDLQVEGITPETDKLTVVTDTKTGNITITAQPGLDFTHAGNEYKVRFKATCYGLTRGHADNPTYLTAEYILQGIPDAADGVSYQLVISPNAVIARDGHGDYKVKNQTYTASVICAKSNGELTQLTDEDMADMGLTMDYLADGADSASVMSSTSVLTISGVGSTIKPEKAITVRLWHGDKQVDGQDIFVVQDGSNSVRIDLDNENDSMLYNGQGVKASGNIVSHISMWDGSENVTSQAKFSIVTDGCTATLPEGSTTITVTALSKNNASVTVTGRYREQDYSTVLTLSKKNNTDKYDLAITPNDIAYNTTTKVKSTDKIEVKVYRTYIGADGNAKTELCQSLPQGFRLMQATNESKAVTYANGKYELALTDAMCVALGDVRYDLLNKNNGVEDYETIPINKTTNLTVKLAVKYAVSTTDAQPTSGWDATMPAVGQGQWLWTWTHFEYSDGTSDDVYTKSYQGESLYIADLDNEMSAVACKQGGKPVAQKSVKTKVSYFRGSELVNFKISNVVTTTGITCATSYANTTFSAAKELTFNVATDADLSGPNNIAITCTDKDGGNARTIVLTIVGVLGTATYELVTSTSEVVYNPNASSNKWSPSSVRIDSLTKSDSGTVEQVTTVPTGYRLWYGTNGSTPTSSVAEKGAVTGASVTVNATTINSVDFYLCNSTSATFSAANVVDKERVMVVSSGLDGKSLTNVKNYYKWGTSGTTAPTGTYTENNIPVHVDGTDYLWNYEVCYNNKSEAISTSSKTCIGFFPKGIGEFSEVYQRTSTATAPAAPTLSADKKNITYGNWGTAIVATDKDNRYLWNCEIVKYSDDTYYVGIPHTAGVQGEGLSVDEKYGVSNGETTAPTTWTTLAAAKSSWGESNPYLWNKETISVGGTAQTPTQHVIAIWTKDGKEIDNFVETYAASNNRVNRPADTSFVAYDAAIVDVSDSKPYLWNKEVINYTDNTSDTKYHVVAIKGTDGTSPYIADLDNEMDSIITGADGKVTTAVALKTNVYLYHGATKMDLTNVTFPNTPSGITCAKTIATDKKSAECTITVGTTFNADKAEVGITLVSGDVSRDLVFTVNRVKTGAKGDSAVVYSLNPDCTSVKVAKDVSLTPTATSSTGIRCYVNKADGVSAPSRLSALPSGWSMKVGNDGTTSPGAYTIGNRYYSYTKDTKTIEFYLYYGTTLIDKETIPVVADGLDGENGLSPYIGTDGYWYIGTTRLSKATPEDPDVWTIGTDGYWYFNGTKTDKKAIGANGKDGQAVLMAYAFKRSATKVTTAPSGGSFTSPHPTTTGWSDGVPDGSDPVYMSSRCFTSDGKTPQQTVWSTPCLMADTADIDICYSSKATQPSSSTLPEQGSNTDNTNWHNAATSSDIWMAVASKVGGVWGDWQVTKIKGEKGDEGRGEISRTAYYALTAKQTDTPSFEDKATSSPATTDAKPFLWKQTTITYNKADANGNTAETFTEIVGVHGTKGTDGDSEDYIYCLSKTKDATLPTYPTAPLTTNTPSSGTTMRWTDDPQGVDSTWQYEYMAVAHKRNGVWGAYGELSLYNNYVEDGTSPVLVDINNEMTSIACDKDGKTLAAAEVKTIASLYLGSQPQSLTALTADNLGSITASTTLATGEVKYTIPSGTTLGEHNDITINVTAGTYSGTAVLTVCGVRAGQTGGKGADAVIYEILPSHSAIIVPRNGTSLGDPSPATITASIHKTVGSATTEFAGYETDNMKVCLFYRKNDTGNFAVFPLNGIDIVKTDTKVVFELRKFNSDDVLDRETIPVVKDGTNGESGTSPVIADLDNEMDSVVTGPDGIVKDAPVLKTNVYLYKGKDPLPITSVTASTTTVGISFERIIASDTLSARCEFTIHSTFVDDSAEIRIGVSSGTSFLRYATFTINKVKAGANGDSAVIYALAPTTTVVKVSKDGSMTPSAGDGIYCYVNKSEGKDVSPLSSLPEGWSVWAGTDKGESSPLSYYGSKFSGFSSSTKTIEFYLKYGNSIIDRETIPVVTDGTDGEPGSSAPRQMYCCAPPTPTAPTIKNPHKTRSVIIYNDIENVTAETMKHSINPYSTEHKWTLDTDGYYTSPNKEVNNSYSLLKISFETNGPMTIPVEYKLSSETNWDYGCISYCDCGDNYPWQTNNQGGSSVNAFAQADNVGSTGYITGTVNLPVSSAGKHYFYASYCKDSSTNRGQDCFKVRIGKIPSYAVTSTYKTIKAEDDAHNYSGWYQTPFDPMVVQPGSVSHYSAYHNDDYQYYDWTVDDDGYYTSTNTDHGTSSLMRLSFSTVGPAIMQIDYKVSSEYGYDVGCISVCDSPSHPRRNSDYNLVQVSGAQSGTVNIQIPTAGSHSVYIAYCKDSETTSGTNCFKFKVRPVESVYIWQVTEVLDDSGIFTRWSDPVKYGAQGVDGCSIRICKYVEGTTYYNDKQLPTPREGETARYIDVVQLEDDFHTMRAYAVKPSVKVTATPPFIIDDGGNYLPNKDWDTEQYKPIVAAELLLARDAYIEMTQGQSLQLQCNGKTSHHTAGASGGYEENGAHKGYAFWAGTNTTGIPGESQIANAPFWVNHVGKLKASDAEVSGVISAKSLELEVSSKTKITPQNGTYYSTYNQPSYGGQWIFYSLDLLDFESDKVYIVYINVRYGTKASPLLAEISFTNGELEIHKDSTSLVSQAIYASHIFLHIGTLQLLIANRHVTILSHTGWAATTIGSDQYYIRNGLYV